MQQAGDYCEKYSRTQLGCAIAYSLNQYAAPLQMMCERTYTRAYQEAITVSANPLVWSVSATLVLASIDIILSQSHYFAKELRMESLT